MQAFKAMEAEVHAAPDQQISLTGDELRTQCRVVEAVLGAHRTHIVFVVEEEVRVVLTGITFAGRNRDRVQVHAVDLRSARY